MDELNQRPARRWRTTRWHRRAEVGSRSLVRHALNRSNCEGSQAGISYTSGAVFDVSLSARADIDLRPTIQEMIKCRRTETDCLTSPRYENWEARSARRVSISRVVDVVHHKSVARGRRAIRKIGSRKAEGWSGCCRSHSVGLNWNIRPVYQRPCSMIQFWSNSFKPE